MYVTDARIRTQLDQGVGELLTVDGDATQQVNEVVVGQEVIQQHPVVHLVFTLRVTTAEVNTNEEETATRAGVKLLSELKLKLKRESSLSHEVSLSTQMVPKLCWCFHNVLVSLMWIHFLHLFIKSS